MKTKTFIIEKKARKYFQAKTGGYPCKILIDQHSENLEIGAEIELDVEDISVRSKYGTDLIFKLAGSLEEKQNAGICTLQHPYYNAMLREECLKLGGRWDSEAKAWVFSGIVADKVEELDILFNDEIANYEITFNETVHEYTGPITLFGVAIAKATGRDSGAKIGEHVALVSGEIGSGGSAKNWTTKVIEGAIIRLPLPKKLVEMYKDSFIKDYNIQITEISC